jgi:hypothetical protein
MKRCCKKQEFEMKNTNMATNMDIIVFYDLIAKFEILDMATTFRFIR